VGGWRRAISFYFKNGKVTVLVKDGYKEKGKKEVFFSRVSN
jgi:hypothetical protein